MANRTPEFVVDNGHDGESLDNLAQIALSKHYEAAIHGLTHQEIGGLLREYMEESLHGGIEGTSIAEIVAWAALFQDIATYRQNR